MFQAKTRLDDSKTTFDNVKLKNNIFLGSYFGHELAGTNQTRW